MEIETDGITLTPVFLDTTEMQKTLVSYCLQGFNH